MDSYVRVQHLRCKFCLTLYAVQGRLDSSPLPSAKSESAFRPEHIHLLLPPFQDGCILLTIFRLVATFCLILLILKITATTKANFITGASVVIANDETGVLYSVRSNSSGMYFVPILPPGHYHLQISKQGFKTIIKPDVVLNVQSAVALNFVLPIGSTSEGITVEAGSSLLNTTDATVSTVIDRKFVENIPLNGRSFQDLISMTPGS